MLTVTCYEDTVGSPYMDWKHPIPGRWHCVLSGKIVYKGKYPHFGTARELIKSGVDPKEEIETLTRYGTVVFKATVGELARLTVRDTKGGRAPPQVAKFNEFKGLAEED